MIATIPPPVPPALPHPRTPGRYAVALVCLGNICRSPMADVVLSTRLAEAGLTPAAGVEVASCGTGDWHVGEPMDDRAAAALRAAGLDPSRHRARRLDAAWGERHDVLLVMDAANLAEARSVVGPDAADRVRLLGDHDPLTPGAEVPDPYYGGDSGFEEVLAMVERTSAVLVEQLAALMPGAARATDPRPVR